MKWINTSFQRAATDLSNHLACGHLTQLNRLVALNEIKKPTWHDPSLDVLIQRGKGNFNPEKHSIYGNPEKLFI
jgi:hypothetical protein